MTLILAVMVSCAASELSPAGYEPPSGFVAVNGVRLHYIDWGGSGEPILLLAGFRDNAHVFDDFAPRFTDRFRFPGLTRRGFGESEKPAGGYETDTRVEDVRQFLDAKGIGKASLIGHSMAGEEMTVFAARYPERTEKLVYLDDGDQDSPLGHWRHVLNHDLRCSGHPQGFHPHPLHHSWPVCGVRESSEPCFRRAIEGRHKALFAYRPDYKEVKAPALAFYAVTANTHYPSHWLPKDADESVRTKAEAWWQTRGHALMRDSVEQFRKGLPHGEIIELDDAKHYVFKGETADEVVLKTREFLLR